MTDKALRTRNMILEKSKGLFSRKGYKAVTMTDICEATGLSRGGLYRYFSSTEEILKCFLKRDYPVEEQIRENQKAVDIMEEQLKLLHQDMSDRDNNLGLAAYEFASLVDSEIFVEGNLMEKKRWSELIRYGISTGEFRTVDVDRATDMIIYSSQGIIMWSQVMAIDEKTIDNIIESIRQLLLGKK